VLVLVLVNVNVNEARKIQTGLRKANSRYGGICRCLRPYTQIEHVYVHEHEHEHEHGTLTGL